MDFSWPLFSKPIPRCTECSSTWHQSSKIRLRSSLYTGVGDRCEPVWG